MLTALRRLAGTWVAKILFGLLILSFAIWGIGDMAKGFFAPDTSLARVAGEAIPLEEGQAALRREMQRLARQLGPQFENDPRIRRAVAEQAVDQLVLDRVLRVEAQRLGMAVPDQSLRDFVFGLPGFRGADDRFSRPLFDSFLRSNGLSEPAFLSLVRADLARQQITMAVGAGAGTPDVLAKPLLRWQNEQRGIALVNLPVSAAPEPPAPEEAQLRRYHENNPDRFSTPEYRVATVAVLTAALIAREVEVTEAEIAAAYEARRDQLGRPERRQIVQALLPDGDKARALAAQWGAGADLDAVTRAAEAAGGTVVDLGVVDRAGVPVPELAEAAFATPAGGVSAPVETGFGWHVLRVVRVEAGESKTLDEAREQLRADLAAEKAADLAFERANRVEDALAGGATIAEVAQRFGLGLARIRTDANGLDEAGGPVELPVIEAARAPLLQLVFRTERGAPLRLQESEAGFAAVEVTEIIRPALRPFESVEAEVRAAWVEDARRRTQEERAAGLLAATRAGKTLVEAAQAAGLAVREIGAIGRDPRAAAIAPELVTPVFELKPQETTMVRTRDGFAVAQLQEVVVPDPDADADGLTRLRGEVAQAMARDLDVLFLEALRRRADVRLNPRMLDILAQP